MTAVLWPPHLPDGGWGCSRGCLDRWPCAAERGRLSAVYAGDPFGLAWLMAGRLLDAAGVLDDEPRELYGRFVGWVRVTPAES